MFYQDGPIYHCTHVTGTVDHSIAEIEYNPACTAAMDLSHSGMLNNEMINKDLDEVPEQATLIILDRNSDVSMENNGKDTKYTRQISRIMHFLRNGEWYNLQNSV